MSIDFTLVLTLAVLVTGGLAFLDLIWRYTQKKDNNMPKSWREPRWWVCHTKSYFPVLLLVLVVRSFIVQPFRVPTGSLEPTVLPGDFMVVNQFTYGLRLPVLNTKVFGQHEPERGDLAVFRWPVDPSVDYVKRVVGIPGDHIEYRDKTLYVNGKKAEQTYFGKAVDIEDSGNLLVNEMMEDLAGISHHILINPKAYDFDTIDTTVPAGYYFMMGDNRDASYDSRGWGFVPEANLVGKPFMVWMSWDNQKHTVRWNRIGRTLS